MEVLDTTVGDFWVAEYSAKQKCFNVDYFKRAVVANAQMVTEKQNNDYLIFGIFKTPEEASAACDKMEEIQKRL